MTGYFSHRDCWKHEMGAGHPECPERLDAIEDRLLLTGVADVLDRRDAPLAPISDLDLAHDRMHVAALRGLSDQLADDASAGGPAYAHVDPDTAMNVHTWQASLRAAGAVLAATDAVMAGEMENAFCAVRPPGHHACHGKAMGFCFLNNIAVAARYALERHGLQRVAVVDFGDLGGFSAPPVVEMLAWIARMARADLHVMPVTVARTLTGADIFGSCFEMAGALDDDDMRARLVVATQDALLSAGATHVLVPPVLGREQASKVHAALATALAVPCAEMLALPASAPGERLQHALHASLRALGVVVVDGGVEQALVRDALVRALSVRTGPHVLPVEPRAVVLAAGRFFGGGLVRDQEAQERLFGLPVVVDGVPLADQFIGGFTNDVVDGAHAIFRAGLAVDAQLRPVSPRGHVDIENVFAAGSVLEGYDPARDGTAAGVAALTGLLAGERAADHARENA